MYFSIKEIPGLWLRVSAVMATLLTFMVFVILPVGPARAGDIKIEQAWTRVTPKGVPVGGGFLTITNNSSVADRLIGASFLLAGRVEIHKTRMVGGVMQMRHMNEGVQIKPGQTITFKPGGLHLMFMMLTKPIAMGSPLRGSLTFEKAGKIEVDFAVARMGSPRPPR